MKSFVLLLQCQDQRGIVARVSDFIFSQGGNITGLDQHSTDPQAGRFFMRVEFTLDKGTLEKEALSQGLSGVAAKFKGQYQLYDKADRLRMGIFVSRPDHCLQELLYLYRSGELPVLITFVASNCENHRETVAAQKIPFHFIPASKDNPREEELLELALQEADFLVLARYMLLLSPGFLRGLGRDIINIHHGLLPSFKGINPYQQAFEKGVKVIGATAHFVTERLDDGPIIVQLVEPVSHRDSMLDLRRKGKNLEKHALAEAIEKYADYRIIREQGKTIIF